PIHTTTLSPYTTLFRSKTSAQRSNRQVITRTPSHECTQSGEAAAKDLTTDYTDMDRSECVHGILHCLPAVAGSAASRKLSELGVDRKSTRLNSSHQIIS